MVGALVAAMVSVVGGEQTLTFTAAQISVPPHGVKQGVMLAPSPKIDGYVVGMKAEVVDAQGRVQGDHEVMLHHVVFAKVGARDATCPSLPAERFYAEGEERQRLELPSPYGYPNRGTDQWGLLYMLMNHRHHALAGAVRYTVRYVTGERRTPVTPYWLDERNCGSSEFDVRGTGGAGSTHSESWDYTLPASGRVVAGGGHLHGGGIRLDLVDTACKRTLFSSRPTWGGPEPEPLLHEPGPSKMSQFTSDAGIRLAAGTPLRLTAVYENSRPHARAMGIMMLYVAPGSVAGGCEPLPKLDVDLGQPGPPPPFTMPLPRAPRGAWVSHLRETWVGDNRFGHERVRLAAGARMRWRFVGLNEHDVTVVGGPEGFSSKPARRRGSAFSWRFSRKGTYRIICSLHPSQMVQRVDVR